VQVSAVNTANIDLKHAESSTSRSMLKQALKEETSETPREKKPKKDMIDLDILHIGIQLQEIGILPKQFDQSKMREHLVECY